VPVGGVGPVRERDPYLPDLDPYPVAIAFPDPIASVAYSYPVAPVVA